MTTLELISDEICLKHFSGYDHPEKPARLQNIINWMKNQVNIKYSSQDILNDNQIMHYIRNVHNYKLIERIIKSKNQKYTYFDSDSIANSKTFDAANKAARLVTTSALLSRWDASYFAVIRPPGHHATVDRVMGFCFFNNIAIACQPFLEQKKRVAIIDFDFHYGNGTADIFWKSPDILYFSTHADPTVNYPSQGFIDEIGEKDGRGFNVAIPFSYGAGDAELIAAFEEIILPILEDYNPAIIGISAGFDGYIGDPVGKGFLKFKQSGFEQVGKLIHNYGHSKKKPIFHTLEGGYNVEALPTLIHSYIAPWIRPTKRRLNLNHPQKQKNIRSREQRTFKYIKQLLRQYWHI
jgi:acetoin utilization deacetylase AcuC-like enzyme